LEDRRCEKHVYNQLLKAIHSDESKQNEAPAKKLEKTELKVRKRNI